ncbi:hypothetical protein ACIQB5_49710 [Streptomyces sp. NPDC088560]|uniref:hypothetical protein n=1 Tax=Streptomyces sp. NPDC088560 TaxID=3365868 RepID=UPI00380CFF7B
MSNPEDRRTALLLSGEAGVGKPAVLHAVATGAVRGGVRVLRAAGVQFEADIGYAGLNHLVEVSPAIRRRITAERAATHSRRWSCRRPCPPGSERPWRRSPSCCLRASA